MNDTLTSRYVEPDTTWEEYSETIPARQVRKGDVLTTGGTVADLTVGHKFVTARIADGRQLFRVPLDEEVRVYRRRETEASRERQRIYDKNRSLERTLEADFTADVAAAIAKINEHYEKDWTVGYQQIGALMEAQAERALWRRYAALVENAHSADARDDWALKGADHATLMDAYIEELKEQLTEGYSNLGIGRSSNQLSNLMEDVERAATVQFIRNRRWYW